MGNVEKAVLLSLSLHALAAAGIALLIEIRPSAPESPSLEVSSVELSLGERDDEPVRNEPGSEAALPEEPLPAPEDQKAPECAVAEAISGNPAAPGTVEIPVAEEPAVEMKIEKAARNPTETEQKSGAHQARVDAPARLQRKINLKYPNSARRRSEQGLVKLNLTVDAFGAVTEISVSVSSGFPDLDAAAVSALRSALFIPAQRDGKPAESSVELAVDFKLR
jgi:protein TonB